MPIVFPAEHIHFQSLFSVRVVEPLFCVGLTGWIGVCGTP